MISKDVHILTDVQLEEIKKAAHVQGWNKGHATAKKAGEQKLESYIEKKKIKNTSLTQQKIQNLPDTYQTQKHHIIYYEAKNEHCFYVNGNSAVSSVHETLHRAFTQINGAIWNEYARTGCELYSVTLDKSFSEWVDGGKGKLVATVTTSVLKPETSEPEETPMPPKNKAKMPFHILFDELEGYVLKNSRDTFVSRLIKTLKDHGYDIVKREQEKQIEEDRVKHDTLKVYHGFESRGKREYFVFIPGRNPIIQYRAYSAEQAFKQLRDKIYEAYKDDVSTTPASIHLDTGYEQWLNNGKPIITATVYYT